MAAVPTFALSDWVAAFQALMPRGRVWPREADAVQTEAVAALLPTHARQAEAAAGEIEDSFPATAGTALGSWELALGLPDPCAGPNPTLAARRGQVVARLAYRGGQSVPYFIGYAAALGYAIGVQEFAPAVFGMPFGRTFGGPEWAHVWLVDAPGATISPFLFGQNHFGDSFAVFGATVLTCELQRIKPAHTVLMFALGGALLPAAGNAPPTSDLLLESGGELLLESGAPIALE